jgi:hypothetical protein
LGVLSHLDVGLVERHIVYYKGKGGDFPQVRAVMSLVNSSYMWLVLAPKVLQLCTNHLVLVLCRFVWVVEDCKFFLVPSRSSSTPLYPSKVLRARERAWLFALSLFSVWDSHLESFKELGTHQKTCTWLKKGLAKDLSRTKKKPCEGPIQD